MGSGTGKVVCGLMIILGLGLILLGSAAPYWLTVEGPVSVNYGLWFYCSGNCSTYTWADQDSEDYTVWFYLTHVLTGLATLLAITVMFPKLCSKDDDDDDDDDDEDESVSKPVVMVLCSGLFGFAGAVVFYVKPEESILKPGAKPDWASFVFACGAGAALVFSIILMILPKSRNSVHPC